MSISAAEEPTEPLNFDGGAGVDIQHCEDEPIRIPGSIQRHGFLLLVDDRGRVVGASENVEEFLEIPLGLIVGAEIAALLEREMLAALRVAADAADGASAQTYLGSFHMRGKFYSVVTHRSGGERVLEFERQDRLVSPELTNQIFTNFLSKMSLLGTETELCQALTQQLKELTGFNRVLLYSFDEQGHGTVLCEENDGVLPSCLGLRFPASDIPRQARDLYVLNTVRIIPDAWYVPSPLVGVGKRRLEMLDLSMSILRSVSPIHLEYMRNMGTMSSMSVSIVWEGKLWGLISAHNAEAKTVPYLVRSACDLLTKFICAQLVSFRTSEALTKMVHFQAVQRRMLTQIAAQNNYYDAFAGHMEELNEVTGADSVAFIKNGQCLTFGATPEDSDLLKLVEWMDEATDMEVFETRQLSSHIEWASRFKQTASGMLAIRISSIRHGYILWFRPEVIETVRWAGQPTSQQGRKKLTPRTSFEAWKELVEGTSAAWTAIEIDSATQFRAAVTTISLKRAEEAVQVGEARFLELTHALPHPVWSCDDAGQLTYVNRRWLDQGFSEEGIWHEQQLMASEDRERCVAEWKTALMTGKPFDVEVRFRLEAEDFERWNLMRVTPYLRANGDRAGWIGTCTDLTDRRQQEAALRMTEKLALTGRMTSVIAHEINNPLETLTNLLYLLSSCVQEDETARSYIGLAESEVQRISGITKQTLRWSKDSTQRPAYGFAGEVFADVLRLFEGQIRNREVEVEVMGGREVQFFGTVGQVQQVVANLVSNAMQAVAVKGRVWLEAREDGDEVEIIVRDEGEGMSAETLRNLFQPFYTTKGDLGNGLGLYISHEIVEWHGGSLKVESERGKGTVVRVRLPANEAAGRARGGAVRGVGG